MPARENHYSFFSSFYHFIPAIFQCSCLKSKIVVIGVLCFAHYNMNCSKYSMFGITHIICTEYARLCYLNFFYCGFQLSDSHLINGSLFQSMCDSRTQYQKKIPNFRTKVRTPYKGKSVFVYIFLKKFNSGMMIVNYYMFAGRILSFLY
jgi:hypothetical protein